MAQAIFWCLPRNPCRKAGSGGTWRDMAKKGATPGLISFGHIGIGGGRWNIRFLIFLHLYNELFWDETFWRIWARSHGHTFLSFSRKLWGFSRRFWDIKATHVRVIYSSGNQTSMIYRLRLTRLNDTMSFPLYYLTIYDTLYERKFGLLSIMNSGRALDE